MTATPFHFFIANGFAQTDLYYIVDGQTLVMSVGPLQFIDGHWCEVPPCTTTFSVAPLCGTGTNLKIDATQPGSWSSLLLAFDCALDFTKPLPTDRLLMANSPYFSQLFPDGRPQCWPVTGFGPA